VVVHVDEARRDDKAFGVDRPSSGFICRGSDPSDTPALDTDAPEEARISGAINNSAVLDQGVELLGAQARGYPS
jgi:hypothetical protein